MPLLGTCWLISSGGRPAHYPRREQLISEKKISVGLYLGTKAEQSNLTSLRGWTSQSNLTSLRGWTSPRDPILTSLIFVTSLQISCKSLTHVSSFMVRKEATFLSSLQSYKMIWKDTKMNLSQNVDVDKAIPYTALDKGRGQK